MRVRSLIPILLLAVVAACSDSSGPEDATITIQDDSFNPSTSTVSEGSTVTWNWTGANAHNVTWVTGSPAASATQSAGTYQRTFTTAGTYEYYCTIHGTPTAGMRGTITVQ